MSDPAAPSEPDAPPPDRPHRASRAPVVIDQEGQPTGEPPPAGEAATTQAAAPEPAPTRRGAIPVVIGILAFVVLAGGIGYLWNQQQQAQQAATAEAQALRQQVAALNQQVERLRAQPAAKAPAELDALSRRMAALENRPAGSQPAPDLAQIDSRLAALEQRQPPDLSPLQQQVKALEQRVAALAPLPQQVEALRQLPQQVETLARQSQTDAARSQQADSALTQRLDTDESRLVTLEHNAGQVSQLAARATRLARLQAAQMALAQGNPLGDIPGAPVALARYAAEPPPTEAGLRLTYPAAEQAALAASTPETAGKPFFSRVLANAEGLVTVRQGDRVVVGNPAAGVLARARTALEAGDLAGTVSDLSSLSGPPAQALQDWLRQARALLAARAALAQLVAKG